MMLLKGKRPVYGRDAWRNTLLLLAVLAVLVAGLVLKRPPAKERAANAIGSTAATPGEADPRGGELARLKMLGRALKLHAEEHDGKFPERIADIQWRQTQPGMGWDGLPAAASRFHHPGDGRVLAWLYYPGHTENDPPESILVASPVAVGAGGGERMVARLNGVAELIPEAEFQRQAGEQKDPAAP